MSASKEWLELHMIQKSPAAELKLILIFCVIILANQQLKLLLYFIDVQVIMFLSKLSSYQYNITQCFCTAESCFFFFCCTILQ